MKRADLIAAHAEVPWFSDQLHRDSTGSCRIAVRNALLRSNPFGPRANVVARSNRKPSTMADLDPVAQRIHHHLQNARVGEVDRAAAAGEIVGRKSRIVPLQPVLGVVDAAERQRSGPCVAFAV